MDDVLLYGLISKAKKPDDFAVVGKYLSVEPYAIMMRRDEPQFEKIVNRALNELFQSGEIRTIASLLKFPARFTKTRPSPFSGEIVFTST